MLKEVIEYGHKIEERVKAMKSEIKENAHGTNSDGKETRTQISSLDQKEETRIKKYEERLRNLQGIFKRNVPTSES